MNGLNLSKSQKKIARQIIEKGLQKEFKAGIIKLDKIISNWKKGHLNNRDAYHKIYDKLINHDKHIGRRYDGMTGSKYLYIIADQMADKVISIEEIDEFDDIVKQRLMLFSGLSNID